MAFEKTVFFLLLILLGLMAEEAKDMQQIKTEGKHS